MMEHFSMAEMAGSNLAVRMGIDNTPSLKVLSNLAVTVTGLEAVRKLFGLPLHVSSGYRCEALERLYSQTDYQVWCMCQGLEQNEASWQSYFAHKAHPKGYAADFSCTQFGRPEEVFDAIASSDVPFDECGLEGHWVHISFDPRMRRQLLVTRFD